LEKLEAEFQVARVTVRQAVDVLEREGLVQRQQGRGTFVTNMPPERRWLRLATDWDTLIANIEDNVPHPLPDEGPPPEPRLDRGDGTAAEDYTFIKSLQSRDGMPYAFVRVHVTTDIFEQAPKRFRTRTALSVLSTLNGVTVARAHQTLLIGAADMKTAQLLGLALNAPTAEAHCVVVDDRDIAIYVADIKLPSIREAAFLRSPLAHARIHDIQVPKKCRGAIYTAADLAGVKPIRAVSALPGFKPSEQPLLAMDKIRQVGEPSCPTLRDATVKDLRICAGWNQ
jgi:GntR family transcriptional regulator